METQTAPMRKRTLRRQQRSIRLKELLADIDTIETRREAAKKAKDYKLVKGYDFLFDLLYSAYCKLVNSEV